MEKKRRWLIDGYLWWRKIGHNYSIIDSIIRVIDCEIRPIVMKPIWLIQILWYKRQLRKIKKKFWKNIDDKTRIQKR